MRILIVCYLFKIEHKYMAKEKIYIILNNATCLNV